MTMDEAKAVLALKADALLGFSLVDAHKVENLQVQRDDAIGRIDAMEASREAFAADLNKKHADELTTREAALADMKEQAEADLAAIKESSAATVDDLTSQFKAATARVAELQVYDAVFQADQKAKRVADLTAQKQAVEAALKAEQS